MCDSRSFPKIMWSNNITHHHIRIKESFTKVIKERKIKKEKLIWKKNNCGLTLKKPYFFQQKLSNETSFQQNFENKEENPKDFPVITSLQIALKNWLKKS